MSRTVSAELWSDWECKNGVPIGALRIRQGTYGYALDNTDNCALEVFTDPRVVPSVRDVIRLTEQATGTVIEYRIQSIERPNHGKTRTLKGLSPFADLGSSGWVRINGAYPTYNLGGLMTPTEMLTTIVFTNLAEDELDWWSIGTVDIDAVRFLRSDLEGAEGWSHAQWIRAMEETYAGEARHRRNGGSGYYLDFLSRVGSTATPMRIVDGKNLIDLQEVQDDGELATAIQVTTLATGGGGYFGIGENAWVLGTIPGSAPYWIPLTDFDTTAAAPIVFDDQVNDYYLLTKTGTLVQITDSRASDSAVLVAATTGLTAGDLVQIVKNSSAHRLTELRNPSAKRLFRVDAGRSAYSGRNLIRNGDFASFSGLVPSYWTVGTNLTANKYPRASATTYTLTGGNGGVSSTTVTITAGPANHIIYEGEWVRWGGTDRLIGATTQLDGSGAGTITMFTAVAVTNGTTITEGATWRNLRNTAFPDAVSANPSGNILWLTGGLRGASQGDTSGLGTYASSGANAITSPEFTVKYVAGLTDFLTAYSTWSIRTAIDLYNRDVSNIETQNIADTVYRNLPAMMLGTGASTQLARALWTAPVLANSEAHAALSCAYALTADQAFRVQCFPTVSKTTSSVDPDPSCILREVVVGVGVNESVESQVGDSPNANINWHRTNRALLARQLTVRNVRVTFADLSRLAGYSITRENVVLGGDVELARIGLTARVVAIVFDIRNPANTQVIIDSRPTRLIKFLSERL